MGKAIPIESIKNIQGNDRLKNEFLRAAEKGVVDTIDVPEEQVIETKVIGKTKVGRKGGKTKNKANQ